MATPTDLFVNYSYPLKVVNKNANTSTDLRSKERIWYSQPRSEADDTLEVLRIALRRPLLIDHISFSILDRACQYELWAVSNEGKKARLLDSDLNSIIGRVSGAGTNATNVGWKPVALAVEPTIVTQIEIKIRRISPGSASEPRLVSLGIKDFLIKRTIKTQDDTLYSLSKETDLLGNPVRKAVQDWKPSLAMDGNSFTFWKSAPQPCPEAVVNFYTTVGDGINPERVDRLWIDPVYSGQDLNMYYSTDPTVGTFWPQATQASSIFTLSSLSPDTGVNLTGEGSAYAVDTSKLISPSGLAVGTIGSSGWIGGTFDIIGGLTGTLHLMENPDADDFSVRFDTTTGIATFTNNWSGNPDSKVLSTSLAGAGLDQGSRLQVILVVSRDAVSNEVTLRMIVSVSGNTISDTSSTSPTHDDLSKLFIGTSSLKFFGPFGYLRNLIVKVDTGSELEYSSFLSDATSFLSPKGRKQGSSGFTTKSPLDNAILVGPFTTGSDAYGGVGEEIYKEKIWTPILKDWTMQRGFYYLPGPIAACHIKIEISNLTPQPYPIYESEIEVPYRVHSISSVQSSSPDRFQEGSVALPDNSTATQSNISSTLALKYEQRSHIVCGSKVVDNIRNRQEYDYRTLTTETARVSALKSSNISSPSEIASATVRKYTNLSGNSMTMQGSSDDPSSLNTVAGIILASPILENPSRALGARTPTTWFLPGGLSVPTETMQQIAGTSATIERASRTTNNNSTSRVRFPSTCVHRYETKTALRDVGLAYFAGIREFQVFTVDYTVPVDLDEYTVISFADSVESSHNMRIGAPGSRSGSYPLDQDLPLATTDAIFDTWNSVGTFVKTSIKTVDRSLHSDTKGSNIEPLGLDGTGGFWSDDNTTWSDTVNVWGALSALVGLDFESNLYFSGRQATKVFRAAGLGSAGVKTRIFDLVEGERVRLCLSIYRPKITSNTLTIQLEDITPITGSVLHEESVDLQAGQWTTIKTQFFTMPADQALLRINLLIDGVEEEVLYVSDLYEESTTIVYSLSNDNGANYYEATEVLNEPNKFLVFPSPGNELKVKIQMYDHRDFAFGFSVFPKYLF